jgi:tetratricopeptide (TPR) repeat protein
LKTNIFKYAFFTGFLIFLFACSTKRNSFVSRNSHALSTKYNILYNGGLALDAGITELKTTYSDNFWERLPVERMQPTEEAMDPGQTKNANFERAETKAIKAIQKHSMNIDGAEKNPQMDEAHLMLGKARYYDQRFVPALEAFNYVLYKYPGSDKIHEVKVWREKTNMRMENDALAVNNLRKLLSEIKFRDQIFADANATLAQAFLNLDQKDSAVVKLKLATEFTKQDEEKARYRFILGQLYEELGQKDSAFIAYQSVIDMNRKSPRQYVIQAHNRQASQFDFNSGDTIAFLKKYKKLLKDRENRPYLGAINHQLALFYDKSKNHNMAGKYYNASLKNRSNDTYLIASNYRNLADIYFNKAKYVTAGMYYDSTLVQLDPRSREHKLIAKKRENLVDVIKYEGIAQANDSILKVVAMDESERTKFYEDYIEKLKKQDELRKIQEAQKLAAAAAQNSGANGEDAITERKGAANGRMKGRGGAGDQGDSPPVISNQPGTSSIVKPGDFYFYNPTTVAYGKTKFRKSWGQRNEKGNWRISAGKSDSATKDDKDGGDNADTASAAKEAGIDPRYTTDFYLKTLPVTQTAIDSLAKDRNFAYYQLGVIYKEKFKEYKLAAGKLEQLLKNNPEERLVLPSLYNLYKIYQIIDMDKALAMKDRIVSQYPDSRYAQILGSANLENIAKLSPEIAYDNLYKRYEAGDYKNVLADTETAIDQFTGDEMAPKFELLKAHTIGKLRGLGEYRKALNFVALNYPNSTEGKDAEALLGKEIPALEKLQFSDTETANWKIVYRVKNPEDKSTKYLQDKIKKFFADRELERLSVSFDLYTETDNFVVVHGMKSEDYAKGIASILKEFKEYKVPDVPIIISGQNYEVVQIKKNIGEYISNPVFVAISVTDQLPFTPPPVQVPPASKKASAQEVQSNDPMPGKTSPPGQNPGMQNLGENQTQKDPGTPPAPRNQKK